MYDHSKLLKKSTKERKLKTKHNSKLFPAIYVYPLSIQEGQGTYIGLTLNPKELVISHFNYDSSLQEMS